MCTPLDSAPPNFKSRAFVGSVRIVDIIKDKIEHSPASLDIVGAGSRQSLKDCLDMLNKNKFRCIPVYDDTGDFDDELEDEKARNYLGMVTIMDILCFMAFKIDEFDEDTEKFELCRLLGLAKDENSSLMPVWIYPSYHHFEVLLEPFWRGTQTVLVRYLSDDVNKVIILSQTDVLRYLYHNLEKVGEEDLNETLKEAGFLMNRFYHRSITVKANKSAQVAFQQMYYYHRDGLAVIEEDEGKVVANISASDLRGISPAQFQKLDEISVIEFLESHSPNGKIREAVVASESTTIKEAMGLILEHNIHRLWVVSDEGLILTKIDTDDLIFKLCLSGHHKPNHTEDD